MTTFSWRYEGVDGTPLTAPSLPDATFPSQADAETWVGETWRELLSAGIEQVSLLRDDDIVYAAMSLRPME